MSWESVDSLPGRAARDGGDGPFRRGSEPVLAHRPPPTPRERLTLWLRSTSDLPSERAAQELALTSSWLYARFADGSVRRVARDAIITRRSDRGRLIYGIHDGEDLALLPRPGCPVVESLDLEVVADARAPLFYSIPSRVTLIAVGATLVAALAGYLAFYLHGAVLFALVVVAWGFSHTRSARVDETAVVVREGPLGIFHTTYEPETFSSVILERRSKSAEVLVSLVFRTPRWGRRSVLIRRIDQRATSRAYAAAQADRAANELADRLGLPVERTSAT